MSDFQNSDSYVRRLQSEHERLETISGLILRRFAIASDNEWEEVDRPELAAKLAALKAGLLRHMDEEESGGAVEEAVSRVPSLSDEARKIYQESDELKEELRKVMDLVVMNQRARAEAAFQQFAIDLKLHDQHESQIVQRGMNWYPYDA